MKKDNLFHNIFIFKLSLMIFMSGMLQTIQENACFYKQEINVFI